MILYHILYEDDIQRINNDELVTFTDKNNVTNVICSEKAFDEQIKSFSPDSFVDVW